MRRPGAAGVGLIAAATLLAACTQATAQQGGTGAAQPTAQPTSQPTQTTQTTSQTTDAPPPTTAPATPRVIVGLGDSVTAGSACHCTDFITLYAALLTRRSGHAVRAVNLGVGGLSTSTLATQLSALTTRAALSDADEVVVTIGANDLTPLVSKWQHGGCDSRCVSAASTAMGERLQSVLRRLRAEAPGARVLVTTYWNVFEDGDVADADYGGGFAEWSDAVTRSANAAIRTATAANDDELVDLYEPFEGHGERNPTALLADDGDHPNAAGHRLIAQTLLAATG